MMTEEEEGEDAEKVDGGIWILIISMSLCIRLTIHTIT